MCGVYFIGEDAEQELWEMIEILNRHPESAALSLKTGGVIRPSDVAPVLANNRSMTPSPFAMKWGYSLPGRKQLIFNARSETAAGKAIFRDGMAQRRCLVPASGYFEWEKKPEGKTKYAIKPAGKTLFYMAGIYRMEPQPVFTILTKEPVPEIAFIHNRMPVILPDEMKNDWLNPRFAPEEILRCAVKEMAYQQADAG